LYAGAGRLVEARAEFERFAEAGFDDLRPRTSLSTMTAQLALVCAILGDVERAPALYERLLPHAGQNIVTPPFLYMGSIDLYLAQLAAVMGRWSDAVDHFGAALAMNERMHAWPYLALTQFVYARVLHVRGDPADRPKIDALLADSRKIADRYGMAFVGKRY